MKRLITNGLFVFLIVFLIWGPNSGLQAEAHVQAAKEKVNINTASVKELQTLPRIGEKVAQRIVDFRTKNGKFSRIEELMKVKGISEKVFRQLKDLITVGKAPDSV